MFERALQAVAVKRPMKHRATKSKLKTTKRTVELPDMVWKSIDRAAKKDRITVNDLMCKIVADWLFETFGEL
jgi:macrodomain Ter protein organizer (MatP/YcbG family)